jgi:hypothetical protein
MVLDFVRQLESFHDARPPNLQFTQCRQIHTLSAAKHCNEKAALPN